jgi:hypothetical protein
MNSSKPAIGSAIVMVCLIALGFCSQGNNRAAALECCSETQGCDPKGLDLPTLCSH